MSADLRAYGRGQVSPAVGTLNDFSGTITAGGTSQQLLPANPNRNYFLFQNHSDIDLWLVPGVGPAVAGQPSILVGAGVAYTPGFVDRRAWHVMGATTGKAFTCKEG